MQRRQWIQGGLAGSVLALGAGGVWLSGAPALPARFPDIESALRWIERLATTPGARSLQGWPLPRVLEHLAQSIEYSMDGYPQPEPAWFQASVGALAGAVFQRRGQMRHDLQAPIPGAPALVAEDLPATAKRLRAAIQRFTEHTGPLQPHFAYGPLDAAAYQRAHLMHLADHARWIETDG